MTRAGRFLRASAGNLGELSTFLALASAGLALSQSFVQLAGLLTGLAVLTYSAHWVVVWKTRQRARSAFEDIREHVGLSRLLGEGGRELGLSQGGSAWRISLYELDVDARAWHLRGRAASNELHAKSLDFAELGTNEGVLRLCLARADHPKGVVEETAQLPDPIVERQAWIGALGSLGFDFSVNPVPEFCGRRYAGVLFKVGGNNDLGSQRTLGLVLESAEGAVSLTTPLQQGLPRPFFEAASDILAVRELLSHAASVTE